MLTVPVGLRSPRPTFGFERVVVLTSLLDRLGTVGGCEGNERMACAYTQRSCDTSECIGVLVGLQLPLGGSTADLVDLVTVQV